MKEQYALIISTLKHFTLYCTWVKSEGKGATLTFFSPVRDYFSAFFSQSGRMVSYFVPYLDNVQIVLGGTAKLLNKPRQMITLNISLHKSILNTWQYFLKIGEF